LNSRSFLSLAGAASLLFTAVACGGSSSGGSPSASPWVTSTNPIDGASGVALNGNVSATFNEAMDPATLTVSSFTLTSGATAIPVLGTVAYASSRVVFWPAVQLASSDSFTATITTEAKNPSGDAMAKTRVWKFSTGSATVSDLPVNLGAAGGFAILAKSGISTVPPSAITGNLGVSPAAASYITGFSLIADSGNVFSSSQQVTGQVFAADYAVPTPTNLTTAVGDMQLAFTDAAGRAPGVTELGAGNIGGMTLAPGVYKWGTGLLIPTDVTLSGIATDVWIFQIAQDLTMSSGATIHLAGGAVPRNVFWQVAGLVDLGTTAHCEGIILGQTSVALHTGASVNGRLLAQTAVTLDASTVVQPAP
jgi:hypothetical protein